MINASSCQIDWICHSDVNLRQVRNQITRRRCWTMSFSSLTTNFAHSDFKSREVEARHLDFLREMNQLYPHAWYARRFFNKVVVSEEIGPHFGMGLDCYIQWSSPIRRLTDLQVSKLLHWPFIFLQCHINSWNTCHWLNMGWWHRCTRLWNDICGGSALMNCCKQDCPSHPRYQAWI